MFMRRCWGDDSAFVPRENLRETIVPDLEARIAQLVIHGAYDMSPSDWTAFTEPPDSGTIAVLASTSDQNADLTHQSVVKTTDCRLATDMPV